MIPLRSTVDQWFLQDPQPSQQVGRSCIDLPCQRLQPLYNCVHAGPVAGLLRPALAHEGIVGIQPCPTAGVGAGQLGAWRQLGPPALHDVVAQLQRAWGARASGVQPSWLMHTHKVTCINHISACALHCLRSSCSLLLLSLGSRHIRHRQLGIMHSHAC